LNPRLDPEELKRRRVIAAAMLAGCLLFLAVGVFMRLQMQGGAALAVVAYVAIGWALVSPAVASMVAEQVSKQPAHGTFVPDRAAFIATYGILESAVIFCAMALIVGALWWPLAAALVPLGVMGAKFPR
jgi:hypothetical protein